MKPTPGFEKLPRAWAQADLDRRAAKLKADLLALPAAERFRLVADLLDAGQLRTASQLAAIATRDLVNPERRGRK